MGVAGMFLGVPVVAVIQYLFNLLLERKLKEKQGIGDPEDKASIDHSMSD